LTSSKPKTKIKTRARVVVAGSANMDCVVSASRHPRIGETVAGDALRFLPGGKGANQAVAAARMGADTVFIGRVGEDDFGAQLQSTLAREGIDTSNLEAVAGANTGMAVVTVADGDNTIVVAPGANYRMPPEAAGGFGFRRGDWLLAQLEIPARVTLEFFREAKRAGAHRVLNPSPAECIETELLREADLIILNPRELELLCGVETVSLNDLKTIEAHARRLISPRQAIIVTLGERGAFGLDWDGATFAEPGTAAKVVDTTGAGDCFTGALAAALCEPDDLRRAVRRANRAAAASTERCGAIPSLPRASELAAWSTGRRQVQTSDTDTLRATP